VVSGDESLRPYSRLSRSEPLLFLPSSSSVVLARLSGPRSTHYFSENLVAPGVERGPLNPYVPYLELLKLNSVASVRKRTIPAERLPFVSEVSANFFRIEGATWSAWRIPTAVFSAFYTGAAITSSK
jgi:hypothetical protein